MQQWEYLVLDVDHVSKGLTSLGWKVSHVNGREIPNWKNGVLYFEYINQLGAQGWELVDTIRYGDTARPGTLLFKRPKPGTRSES
jgi:hypothetical protein